MGVGMTNGLSPGIVLRPNFCRRLQWLMFLRVAFITVLLGSTIAVHFNDQSPLVNPSLFLLYSLIVAVYALTFVYALLFSAFRHTQWFVYLQLGFDTLLVTALIYATGGLASIFTFLYPVVVIYGGVFIYKRGSLAAAALSSLEYGGLAALEYLRVLTPFYTEAVPGHQDYSQSFVVYKIVINVGACFLVAYLSSYLADQTIKTETELEAKRKNLKELEAFNASIVHSMDSGLLTVDASNRITSFNRAAEEITGYHRWEATGKQLAEMFPGVERMLAAEGFAHTRPYRHDMAFRTKDGTEGYLGFSVSPLRGPDGRDLGKLLIFQDLTALKIMEAHIKRVDKLAAIGEMAAGIAHEIKNPLASMTGSIQLLKGEIKETPVTEKLMRIVLREADRLIALINDFLLFARPNSGRTEPVELASAIEETLVLFAQEALNQKGARTLRRLTRDLWVEMDPKHVRQILWNLLLNAAEAVKGNGTIEVSTAESGGWVQVAVKDNGCGIREEDVRKIFDPFFTTKPHGTGLGLSIVHRLLESYDGHLDVKSRPNEGSTFVVYLKRAAAPAQAVQIAAQNLAPESECGCAATS